eukprot:EG_transcript_9364
MDSSAKASRKRTNSCPSTAQDEKQVGRPRSNTMANGALSPACVICVTPCSPRPAEGGTSFANIVRDPEDGRGPRVSFSGVICDEDVQLQSNSPATKQKPVKRLFRRQSTQPSGKMTRQMNSIVPIPPDM